MEQWEYFSVHLEADMHNAALTASPDIPGGQHARDSPLSLIPQLNSFGAEGWELVAIHPLKVGNNEDFQYPNGASGNWGKHYFCTFKRRKYISTDM